LVIEHHYLHRKCPISFCWGIAVEGKILGVLTVGKPCSWSATCGVVGEKYADMGDPAARSKDVFELNRLWAHDCLPRCTESRFVGWCLRWLRKFHPNIILISYADGSRTNPDGLSHVGFVYQATRWIYAGTSAAFTDITLKGYSDYRSVPMDKRGAKVGNKRAWATNPDAIRTTRTPKHRYVWFSNPADQKLLAWTKQPYHPTSLARVDRTTNSSSDADASILPDIPAFTQALTRSIPRGALTRASSSPKIGSIRDSQASVLPASSLPCTSRIAALFLR